MSGPDASRSPSSAEWGRIRELFADALERPLEERADFLESTCGEEPRLKREVESLLAAHDVADTFLDTGRVDALRRAVDLGASESTGPAPQDGAPRSVGGAAESAPEALRFGPYRAIRELGRGGMGTVYLGERADDRYERKVAIKLVRTLPAAGLEHRFHKEQRILASLEHPSIARLYDAGTTAAGQPYLVMEYVDGERIDAYCDRARLSVEERVRLFDRVCAAVEFAHGRLVVHRDLKPSNILVTPDGEPKLLDFGVARLLDPGDDGSAEPTMTGLRALTPEYASPEQLRGDPVSTSSDVWALGVLLYRLLTGRHPYSFRSRSPFEVERVLLTQPPRRPSEAAREESGEGGTALARRLRGDLDNVVLAALRLEPTRRYGTVAELRADLRAHLAGFPVGARPDTWRYRAGKFVRRNRIGLVAASLVALAVLGGLTGIAWQGRVASREAARAGATRDYLVGMFESLDPDAVRGPTLRVEQLLDLGVERLDAELGSEPDLRAEVAGVLGGLYQRLGLFDKARPLLEDAHADLVARHGDDDPASVAALGRLAAIMRLQGELSDAEPLARAALAANRRLYGARDPQVARSLADLGGILRALGNYEESRELQREALEIDRAAGDREAEATDLSNLGLVHEALAEYDEARRLLEESLRIRRGLFGDRDSRVATSMLNLASALQSLGEFDEAIAALEECLSIRRELLGDDHPDVAVALNQLGLAQQTHGNLDAARAAHLEALRIRREVFGEDHPEVASSLNNLGVVAYFAAEYETAADDFERVAAIWSEQLGEEHPDVLTVMNNLGAARREAGQLAEAEVVLRRVLEVRERALPEGHPQIAQSYSNLAALLDAREKYAEAEEAYRVAIAGWRAALGEDHPNLAFGLYGLGLVLNHTGRCAAAEAPFREALAIREKALDPASTDIAVVRLRLGLCRLENGDAAEADSLLREALPPIEARWGPDDELAIAAREGLRRAAAAGGRAAASPKGGA